MTNRFAMLDASIPFREHRPIGRKAYEPLPIESDNVSVPSDRARRMSWAEFWKMFPERRPANDNHQQVAR